MEDLSIKELNRDSKDEIALYEKSLYYAFSVNRKIESDCVRNYNHKLRRCSTKLPYDNQYILVAQIKSKIIAGISVNFDLTQMHIEYQGFKVDKNEKICEAFQLFNNSGSIGTNIIKRFGDLLLEKLTKEGFTKIYSTCIEKRLQVYKSFGFKAEGYNIIDNRKCYLLQMKLPPFTG